MAETAENSGGGAVNAPAVLPAESIAALNSRMAQLTETVGRIAKPPLLSAGNVIAVLSALLVLAMAAFGAWGLSDRINHVNDHIEQVENHLGGRADRLDDHLGGKLDKLSDQLTRMDERTSTLEGRLAARPENNPGKN